MLGPFNKLKVDLTGVLSPLLGAGTSPSSSPRLPHSRKRSTDFPTTSSTLLTSSASSSPYLGLPRSPTVGSSRRTFYDGLNHNTGSRAGGLIRFVKNLLLRPILLLSRRGPIVPLLTLLALLFFFTVSSSAPTTQSMKRRVQGAVGPYIPERAANAINWRSPGIGRKLFEQRQQEQERQKKIIVNGNGNGMGLVGMSGQPRTRKAIPSQFELKEGPPRRDGRTVIEEGKTHPIPALMAEAKVKWKALKERQSTTFREAITEYVRRYGRRPPKGFDKWYAFAKANHVQLIDEFDIIDKDIALFRAFSPANFRSRVQYLIDTFDATWIISIKNGESFREGELAHHDRAVGVVQLMKRFVHEVPDMKIVHNGHDGARIPIAWEERDRLTQLGKKGQLDDKVDPEFEPVSKGPEPYYGYSVFCPPGSAVREKGFDYGWPAANATGLELGDIPEGAIGTVIDRVDKYMDVCDSPQYRHFHSTTSWVYSQHPKAVLPLWTPGVQTTFGDIHGLIVEQLDLVQEHDPSWESRPFTSLVWRGQTSGPLWDALAPWKTTHRARIHLLSHEEKFTKKIVVTESDDTARVVEVENYRVNPLFLDTGMIGPAVQCVVEDGTCDKMYEVFQGYDKRMSFDRASLYKYVLDIDGNSWSGRFRRLMKSNAAVVKSTLFDEFWTDWAIPWLHYIPMQVDYSDMWDIMAFFRGGLDGEGSHDALGKQIATAGQDWVEKYYRGADLESYQFRLMLEYGRLYTDETSPGSNDYNGPENVEPIWYDVESVKMMKRMKRSTTTTDSFERRRSSEESEGVVSAVSEDALLPYLVI